MSNWLTPYLTFNGNCEEAIKFYQKALGGETQIMRYGNTPPNPAFTAPDEFKNLIMHAELIINGHIIRFSDTLPNAPSSAGNNISFVLEFNTQDETRTIFDVLSEGGKIEMDLQATFFSPLFAKFTDRFGIIWQLICKS